MKKILILLNLILVGFCTFSQTENVITHQEVTPALQKQEKFFIENKGLRESIPPFFIPKVITSE